MRQPLPPLNQIKTFEAAARHQSFALAAEELHVTSAAVSRLVKALEQQLEVPLFHRRARKVILTQPGAQYLLRLTPALDAISYATSELKVLWHDTLTISAFPSVSQRWLVSKWASFNSLYPECSITINTILETPDFSKDGIEAAIRAVPPNDLSILWDKVHDDYLIPVCNPSLCDPENVSLEEMIHLPRLQSRTRPDDWIRWFNHADHPIPDSDAMRGLLFDSIPLAIEASVQGVGATIAIKGLIEPEIKAGTLVPLFPQIPPIPCPFYITYPPNQAHHPVLQKFHKWLLHPDAKSHKKGDLTI